ncbi:radical SAM family heme chaperone HemW [Amaricoccus sp.]|uniref:radical SAM family heme chaperone HemW n=1 Tax=Amaricoccus sp. TaxID=1872485 RepID=UPI001B5A7EBA|nr:radical SAM family heme chaperone HemW [Amaricoccus sp.]MBP7240606.1 coproporphyrinogen III oxidase [Amaricoccus sp.]
MAETPAEDWRAGGFGVYVHWPFCAAKCPYCDFNSHVRTGVDHGRWRRALVREIAAAASKTPGRRVTSVFFGGGTPSLMEPETVAAVLEAVAEGWDLDPGAEVTLEANPTSVEAGRFRGYAAAGVNRLSLGVQALRDADLRALGRLHDVAAARAAFETARAIFPRISFDLIYARQGQTLEAWRTELCEALTMAADHLSLYQLTIEPGTAFGALARQGRLRGLPDGELAAGMYEATQEICEVAGMGAYEVSNHARPGAEGRHNLVYWRYGDYVGIGPGSHGRLTLGGRRWATETERAPEAWLTASERGRATRRETIDPVEQAVEMAMMGLRLDEGIDLDRYARLAGLNLPAEAVAELEALGLVSLAGNRLRATAAGRPVLNAVLKTLLIQ